VKETLAHHTVGTAVGHSAALSGHDDKVAACADDYDAITGREIKKDMTQCKKLTWVLSPTWLNNFPFPSSAPLTLLSSLSGWPEQAGADFLILGLSFLSQTDF
jgi:hypothetical protein